MNVFEDCDAKEECWSVGRVERSGSVENSSTSLKCWSEASFRRLVSHPLCSASNRLWVQISFGVALFFTIRTNQEDYKDTAMTVGKETLMIEDPRLATCLPC